MLSSSPFPFFVLPSTRLHSTIRHDKDERARRVDRREERRRTVGLGTMGRGTLRASFPWGQQGRAGKELCEKGPTPYGLVEDVSSFLTSFHTLSTLHAGHLHPCWAGAGRRRSSTTWGLAMGSGHKREAPAPDPRGESKAQRGEGGEERQGGEEKKRARMRLGIYEGVFTRCMNANVIVIVEGVQQKEVF